MLNEEKIKLMTKIALYEQKEGKIDLPTSKYIKSDYLSIKMINSAITMTLSYVLLLLFIFLINAEAILSEIVNMDLIFLGRNLVIIYVLLFIANMIVTYLIQNYRFRKSRENLSRYNGLLKELLIMYRKEEEMSENDKTIDV